VGFFVSTQVAKTNSPTPMHSPETEGNQRVPANPGSHGKCLLKQCRCVWYLPTENNPGCFLTF